jgi:hypothetical protein
MVTSNFNGQYYETIMNFKTLDNHIIYISNSPDTPMVFSNYDLFTLEVKDIIGMSNIKITLSFRHLIDLIICALDSIDYAEPEIMNIPSSTNIYESYSLIFDYLDDDSIHFEIYKRNPVTSLLIIDIPFNIDSIINFVQVVLDDYLEKNHRVEAVKYLQQSGIIIY